MGTLGQRPAEPRSVVLSPQLPLRAWPRTERSPPPHWAHPLRPSVQCVGSGCLPRPGPGVFLGKMQIKTSKALQPRGVSETPLESIITYRFIPAFNYCLSLGDLALKGADNGLL